MAAEDTSDGKNWSLSQDGASGLFIKLFERTIGYSVGKDKFIQTAAEWWGLMPMSENGKRREGMSAYSNYPKIPDYNVLIHKINEYARLKHEYGAQGIDKLLIGIEEYLKTALNNIYELPIDNALSVQEPDDLTEIRKLRPRGVRKIWDFLDMDIYREKLQGALLGRFAGCTLGAVVEFWETDDMQKWAEYIGDPFPPADYWSSIKDPLKKRYRQCKCLEYTKGNMDGVPVDDDIAYTLLGLLIAEDYGLDFTTEDIGKAWLKYLPFACTAEEVALNNLKSGIFPMETADRDNPYCQWIGADIRSDPWAYIAPAFPEKAAELAYRDAYLSHRRNGIYGEMFFSAAQSAAFAVDNPVDAIKIGLTEIPADCCLSVEIKWALKTGKEIKNHKDARQAVDDHFKGMSGVHTNNNACLTIFGLMIGGTDVTKVISETVAMGLDNDCNAASAGSIVGAITGKKGVPGYWYKSFNNKVHSYLTGHPLFTIDDLVARFSVQAEKIFHS